MGTIVLQFFTGVVGILTLLLGGLQLARGISSPIYAEIDMPTSPILDSNLRFFGGLGFGLGLILLSTIFNIEEQTTLFRVSWGLAFIGGIGRVISIRFVGSPSGPLLAFTLLEVIGAPIFVFWQSRLV
jgi:hypothetical protein